MKTTPTTQDNKPPHTDYRIFTNPITGSMVIGLSDGPPLMRFEKGEEDEAAEALRKLLDSVNTVTTAI